LIMHSIVSTPLFGSKYDDYFGCCGCSGCDLELEDCLDSAPLDCGGVSRLDVTNGEHDDRAAWLDELKAVRGEVLNGVRGEVLKAVRGEVLNCVRGDGRLGTGAMNAERCSSLVDKCCCCCCCCCCCWWWFLSRGEYSGSDCETMFEADRVVTKTGRLRCGKEA
jgi:hypothetical protein